MSKQNKKNYFGGRQILLLGLVALVITAGYYRWTIEKEQLTAVVPTVNDISDNIKSDADNNPENENPDGNSGESSSDISKLRRERDSSRSQSVEEWNKILKSGDAGNDSKKDAEKKIAAETENAEKERKIETLVKSKGFDDCIAYVDDGGVSVTVGGGEIDGSKVAQIKDIILSVTDVSVKNIKINAI